MSRTLCDAGSPLPQTTLFSWQRSFAATFLRAVEGALMWRERARSRRILLGLDDRMLRDIGIDRATARHEGSQPFWKP